MTEELNQKQSIVDAIPENILANLVAFLRFARDGKYSGHVTLRLHEGGVKEIETTQITKAGRKKDFEKSI